MSKMSDFFDRYAPSWSTIALDEEKVIPLLDKLEIKEGTRVLDLACGCGIITPYLHDYSKATVLGIDIAPRMIEEAKNKGYEGCEFQTIDLMDLGGEFDYVVCYNAYPHFTDLEAFGRKIHSLLSKGGKLYVLHSLGRERLNCHHKGMDPELYRDILRVDDEVKSYLSRFEVLESFDKEDCYGFILRKK